jgi:biopolymer transport protein ExbD
VVVDPPEPVIVRLRPDGSLWINQSAVKLDDLRGSLNVSALRALIVLLSF